MEQHNCDTCPLRARYDRNSKSLMGRFWRWHIRFCPGWKAYFQSLDANAQQLLVNQYQLKR
ncbi:hypothetical protein LX69_00459 [Breznakibacter xylanolyticus]|uniref:Uncharacterized protein n=1 Tax=Breznakibacter xylanolyticus TaxID=990 RepID=A0A2W7QDR9_9BACT|nr:hypothetical protein [Breznakibacter xylanolyticus]PZX20009.1 hypothetical protein LX69_00459 [Breznakibacter xylanolyticus]